MRNRSDLWNARRSWLSSLRSRPRRLTAAERRALWLAAALFALGALVRWLRLGAFFAAPP